MANTTYSQKLENRLTEVGEKEMVELSDITDYSSTSGHDNDSSTGPEFVDIRIGLAFQARDYDKEAKIFFAEHDGVIHYQFGKDEDDAVRRFDEAVSAAG